MKSKISKVYIGGLICILFIFISSLQIKTIRNTYATQTSTIKLGVFLSDYTTIPDFEAKIGRRLDTFLWYQSIIEDLNLDLANYLKNRGITLQLALEPRNPSGDSVNQPAYKLSNITRGDFDTDITRWATQLKNFGEIVYFRPMCEMNGDWTPWSGTANDNEPADYVPAWRHIKDIFTSVGATNVKFVWAPNSSSSSQTQTNDVVNYYPGDDYVDWLGINGYNWGTLYNWSSWQSFAQIFSNTYNKMSSNNLFSRNQATVEIDTSGFLSHGDAILTQDSQEKWEGNYSLKISTNGAIPYQGFKADGSSFSPDKTYTFSVSLKGSGMVYLEINDGFSLGQSSWITLSDKWKRYWVTYRIRPDAKILRTFILTPTPQTVTFYADALQLEEGDIPKIFTYDNTKPIMICETASTEIGGNKAAWITDTFSVIPIYFPRIKILHWFNVNKETDWRVESSDSSLNAFIKAAYVNQPPVLNPIGNKTVNEGELLQFTVSASDPDGDSLTYVAYNLPLGATFNTSTRTFSWPPTYTQAGTYVGVTFEVSDGSLTDNEAITIMVNNMDTTPPTITNISDSPDPFRPRWGQGSKISYTLGDNLSTTLDVSVDIYDKYGRLIKTLGPFIQALGSNSVTWDGKNSSGAYVANATYKYRIKATDGAGNYTYSGYYDVTKK